MTKRKMTPSENMKSSPRGTVCLVLCCCCAWRPAPGTIVWGMCWLLRMRLRTAHRLCACVRIRSLGVIMDGRPLVFDRSQARLLM